MDYAKQFAKGQDVADFKQFSANLIAAIGGLDHEVLVAAYLTADNKLIDFVQEGTGDATSVGAPHENFINRAKALGAVKFVIAHNHPSEYELPSPSGMELGFPIPRGDIGFTVGLLQETRGSGVRLVDHLVVGHTAVRSIRSVLSPWIDTVPFTELRQWK